MANLLDSLNEKQREAVLGTEGYVRVIAGAGSGKTKLLVSQNKRMNGNFLITIPLFGEFVNGI